MHPIFRTGSTDIVNGTSKCSETGVWVGGGLGPVVMLDHSYTSIGGLICIDLLGLLQSYLREGKKLPLS